MSTAKNTATIAPTAPKPAFVLANFSHDTAVQVAKGLVKAAGKHEGATRTLLGECVAAVKSLPPLTSAQWDKQVSPSIRDAFKRSKGGLAETTVASYRSRFKTAGLAIASDVADLQPKAGETFPGFLARVALPLASAKLADGRSIYDASVIRAGRPAKPSKGTGTGAGSKGAADRSEGGMDERAPLAAALILTGQNMARAQKLTIVMQSYADAFDKWTASILSEADKKELQERVAKAA